MKFYEKKDCYENIINNFLRSQKRSSDYESLFMIFLKHFLIFSSHELSFASYPGSWSDQGKFQDDIEGFYRILPLFSVWLSSNRPSNINIEGSGNIDLLKLVKTGIINAVNPSCKGYYGQIMDNDGRIIAASMFALSLWLVKKEIWDDLDQLNKEMIGRWLYGVNKKKIIDNNWHLFIVMTNAVLKHLGMPYDNEEYLFHYNRHKSFYKAYGWYSDGPNEIIDCYNAWEVHPYLIWIDQIDPTLDREFIRKTTKEFLTNFIKFFSPNGFPIFGRSICYRMALPTPIILAERYGWSPLTKGHAKAVLDATWSYFLKNGAVKNGLITQGYLGEQINFLDDYSGPASCNWSLMSLVSAFLYPQDSSFWKEFPSLLPVQISSYKINLYDIGLTVVGEKTSSEISIIFQQNKKMGIKIQRYSLIAKIIDKLLNYTMIKETFIWKIIPWRFKYYLKRPNNTTIKYGLKVYSSKTPFCNRSN